MIIGIDYKNKPPTILAQTYNLLLASILPHKFKAYDPTIKTEAIQPIVSINISNELILRAFR